MCFNTDILILKIKVLFCHDKELLLELLHELGAKYGSSEKKGGLKISNQIKAARYYERAANMGHEESQYDLGFMYWAGEIGKKDTKKALFWLRKAAEKGYEPAIDFLRVLESQ